MAITAAFILGGPIGAQDAAHAPRESGSCESPIAAWFERTDVAPRIFVKQPGWTDPDPAVAVGRPSPVQPDGQIAPNAPRNTAFRVRTESGVLQLQYPDDVSPESLLSPSPIGDLDGDGRSEVLVRAHRDGAATAFIIDGRTAPGSYFVNDVGVRLPAALDDLPIVSIGWVGNQDDRVGDEVAVLGPDGVVLVSGLDLMGHAGGEALESWPESILDLEGPVIAVLDLGDEHPAILTHTAQAGAVELVRVGGDSVRLTTSLEFVDSHSVDGSWGQARTVMVKDYRGDRVLVMGYWVKHNSATAAWNLDDPCSHFDGVLADSAVAASPVSADPLVTG